MGQQKQDRPYQFANNAADFKGAGFSDANPKQFILAFDDGFSLRYDAGSGMIKGDATSLFCGLKHLDDILNIFTQTEQKFTDRSRAMILAMAPFMTSPPPHSEASAPIFLDLCDQITDDNLRHIYMCRIYDNANHGALCIIDNITSICSLIDLLFNERNQVADMAHDLNNILAIIDGYTRVSKNHAQANPEIQNFITKISDATQRGFTIAANIQETTRKKMNLRPESFIQDYINQSKNTPEQNIEHANMHDGQNCTPEYIAQIIERGAIKNEEYEGLSLKSYCALVVEQNPQCRGELKQSLEALGLRCITTDCAHDALSQQDNLERIDFLITQNPMPRFNIYRFVDLFTAMHPETNVIITSRTGDHPPIAPQSEREKAITTLTLPTDCKSLIQTLLTEIKKKHQLSQTSEVTV